MILVHHERLPQEPLFESGLDFVMSTAGWMVRVMRAIIDLALRDFFAADKSLCPYLGQNWDS